MDVNKLLKDELKYELLVRGFTGLQGETASSMRRQLQDVMKTEAFGEIKIQGDFVPAPLEEVEIIINKTEALEQYVSSWKINAKEKGEEYIDTKLKHLYGRLQRLNIEDKPETKHILNSVSNVITRLEAVELQVDEVRDALQIQILARSGENILMSAPAQPSSSGSTHTVVTNIHKHQFEPRKWEVNFTGKGELSVSAFLEIVEEKRKASHISVGELLGSVTDLLKDDAAIWYRSVQDRVKTWKDFVGLLREEFQPYHYEQELWAEIRRRTKGQTERVGIYFAFMSNLFRRLPTYPSEEDRLNVLRQNIYPYFIHSLGLATYATVEELLRLCKRLELNRDMAVRCEPPPTQLRGLLEPDLAYKRGRPSPSVSSSITPMPSRRIMTIETRIKCWNCLKEEHRFSACTEVRRKFCFGCGMFGVIKRDCSRCSGNGQDGEATGRRRVDQLR